MNYMSVCSGIEAASVAWKDLGWNPVGFSEIDKFPSRLLAHHYPGVRNFGDFTTIRNHWLERIGIKRGSIDLLVGGTPCQDFSVAGLRAGLDGDRGQLTIEYARLARRLRPRWLVWENVPGVLSIDGGRAFGLFLGLLGQFGYGFAYRVLDAQHFGVPQRRRRVFLVGYLGDWRRAAAVLFERNCLSGDSAPRREEGKSAPTIPSRRTGGGGLGTDFDCDGGLIPQTAGTLGAGNGNRGWRNDLDQGVFIPHVMSTGQAGAEIGIGIGTTLNCNHEAPILAHSLRADGFDASEDGTGRGTPLAVVAIQERALCENPDAGPDGIGVAFTLESRTSCQAVSYGWSEELTASRELAGTIQHGGMGGRHEGVMTPDMAVRRLTPRECERLQGFPDDYTKISDKTADGPRYKALGNSMARPVMQWIGERIQMVEGMTR